VTYGILCHNFVESFYAIFDYLLSKVQIVRVSYISKSPYGIHEHDCMEMLSLQLGFQRKTPCWYA